MKASLIKVTLLPRVSRHGKLLTDIYRVRTPEVTRLVTTLNKKTGEYETKHKVVAKAVDRAMTPEEMAVARTRLRADGPTRNRGKKNTGGAGAGNKKVKASK